MILLHVCFFFKQKTAYEMRISDWSSDVCSSDLRKSPGDGGILKQGLRPARIDEPGRDDVGADILLPELGCKILDQLCLRGTDTRIDRTLGRRLESRSRADEDERPRSEEHTYELQSLMRISYAVLCLKTKKEK